MVTEKKCDLHGSFQLWCDISDDWTALWTGSYVKTTTGTTDYSKKVRTKALDWLLGRILELKLNKTPIWMKICWGWMKKKYRVEIVKRH